MSVPSLGQYRTLDFIAKSANTTITFKSWGHILINGPPDVLNCGKRMTPVYAVLTSHEFVQTTH